ncbi:MAG: P1 family peptidase, partial [Candidatus Limnocylindria bacterium]
AGPLEGSVGAGTGATVAKLAGPAAAVKGGVGSAGRRMGDGSLVAALAVTNAVGSVVGRDGTVLAAPRASAEAASPEPAAPEAAAPGAAAPSPFENTTLAVIGTDASLDRAQCRRLAELGHDALARSILPVHTMYDGDAVFVLATGTGAPLAIDAFVGLGIAAVDVLSEAIERSVLLADFRGGVPSAPG